MPNLYSLSWTNSASYLHRAEDWRPTLFTLEAWVKPTSFSALQNIFSFSQNDREFQIDTDGKLRFNNYNAGFANVKSNTALTLNVWQKVGLSFNDTTRAYVFYLNGSSDGSGTTAASTGWEGPSAQTTWGARVGGGSQPFVGKMDELWAFADIRSGTEITNNLYTQTPDGDNLYYVLKLDEGTGTSAADTSGGSRTFTLSGSTLPAWSTDVPFGAAVSGVSGRFYFM